MITRLMVWWYQRALEGASIELKATRLKVIEVNSRIGFYKHKLTELRTNDGR